METKDLARAVVINIMLNNRYYLVKEFVFSNILEQYVALAVEKSSFTDNENLVLIDVFGNVIETKY